MMENTVKIYSHILPEKIHILKFIIEGYDNLAVVSTVDRSKGLVTVCVPELLKEELVELLDALASQIT